MARPAIGLENLSVGTADVSGRERGFGAIDFLAIDLPTGTAGITGCDKMLVTGRYDMEVVLGADVRLLIEATDCDTEIIRACLLRGAFLGAFLVDLTIL